MNKEFLKQSESEMVCHWKGTANYSHLEVDGRTHQDAAWFYAEPSELAKGVKGRVAFWKGVQVFE